MAYTLSEAVTKTREIVNEDTPSFFSDSEIEGWIKEGVIKISTTLLSVVTYDTITLSGGQYRYTSSDHSWIGDCLMPKFAYYNDSGGPIGLQVIYPLNFGHLDRTDSEPTYYHFDSAHRAFYILQK